MSMDAVGQSVDKVTVRKEEGVAVCAITVRLHLLTVYAVDMYSTAGLYGVVVRLLNLSFGEV